MSILEAKCQACGEAFNPQDKGDLEHYVTIDGDQCGGRGVITGEYNPQRSLWHPSMGDPPPPMRLADG